MRKGIYASFFKRLFDLMAALVVILLFWWVYVIVAVLVRIKLGSPVLFCQQRPGKDGEIFQMYKFRTMTDERDEDGQLMPDEVRLTRFGRILRSTSLDELPELFNILKGDMSLVGPRPLLVQYLPLYNEEQKHRHDVRPGLTGLAQVNGRNAISWPEKFRYDVEYVKHVTFMGDVKIMIRTVGKIFKREGINTDTGQTMEPFHGNEQNQ